MRTLTYQHYTLGLISKAQIDGMDVLEGGREGGQRRGRGKKLGQSA